MLPFQLVMIREQHGPSKWVFPMSLSEKHSSLYLTYDHSCPCWQWIVCAPASGTFSIVYHIKLGGAARLPECLKCLPFRMLERKQGHLCFTQYISNIHRLSNAWTHQVEANPFYILHWKLRCNIVQAAGIQNVSSKSFFIRPELRCVIRQTSLNYRISTTYKT